MDGLAELIHGFFFLFLFFLFDLLRRATNCLGKGPINRDDVPEAVGSARLRKYFLTASENIFCSSDGEKRKRDKEPIDGVPLKKQSIFYKYVPYWADLVVRHAIDGMHLKKNVFGNTIGLLLETSAKTKDTLKSRQDQVTMKIREDLHPIDNENGRYELPSAYEKKAMCESLRGVRVPSHFHPT